MYFLIYALWRVCTQGEARYVIVLAEASFTTTPFFDCLKRLSIVPADVASVVSRDTLIKVSIACLC